MRQRLSAGLPWLTQGLLFWAHDMLLNTWEARMGVFANSSNKRVISEHHPKLDGFWHQPVKARVVGDFGDNSVPVPQCYMHEWGWVGVRVEVRVGESGVLVGPM